jgi:hypothetical protein
MAKQSCGDIIFAAIYDYCLLAGEKLTTDSGSAMIAANLVSDMIVTLVAHEVISKYTAIWQSNDTYFATIPRDIVNYMMPMLQTGNYFAGYNHVFGSAEIQYGIHVYDGIKNVNNREYTWVSGKLARIHSKKFGADIHFDNGGYKHGLCLEYNDNKTICMHWFHGWKYAEYVSDEDSVDLWNIYEPHRGFSCISRYSDEVRRLAFAKNIYE